MTQSFLRMFRGAPAPAPLPVPKPERIARHSTGLGEFSRYLGEREGLTVLDLGKTSPRNIAYLTAMGHKVYNEDVLAEAADPTLVRAGNKGEPPSLDKERFLAENLRFGGAQFDAVLCWDLPDYLHESLVKVVIERLASVMRPGGALLGFFHTSEAGAEAPRFRYHITGPDALELQPLPRARLERVFNNRHIENLFQDFRSLKFFLARDHIREVLVVR